MTEQAAPKIELKGIEYAAFASEETHCYSATLYVDGVKWGKVGNEGHGGPDYFHGEAGFNYANTMDLDARIKATMPQTDVSYLYGDETPAGTHMMDQSLECICGELVNVFLVGRDLKRAMKTKMLFTKPQQAGIYEIPLKQKGRTWPVEDVRAAVKTPDITVLNLLPFDEALTIFRAASA